MSDNNQHKITQSMVAMKNHQVTPKEIEKAVAESPKDAVQNKNVVEIPVPAEIGDKTLNPVKDGEGKEVADLSVEGKRFKLKANTETFFKDLMSEGPGTKMMSSLMDSLAQVIGPLMAIQMIANLLHNLFGNNKKNDNRTPNEKAKKHDNANSQPNAR